MSDAYEKWRVRVQFTAGIWTDITADVDTVMAPMRATSGATPETTAETGSFVLTLRNVGFKYTPGNAGSAYALSTGMAIELAEVFGEQVIYLFTGTIDFPDITSANMSMTQDQTILVTAVDALSRWETSPTFISTLGAHILGSTPARDLIGYWPLADPQPPFIPTVGVDAFSAAAFGGIAVGEYLAAASGPAIPGDDLIPVHFTVTYSGGAPIASAFLSLVFTDPIILATGDTITISFWANPTAVDDTNPLSSVMMLQGGPVDTPVDEIILGSFPPSLGGDWEGSFALNSGAWGSDPSVGRVGNDTWQLVTAQLTIGQPAIMRVNGSTVTASAAGVAPASATFERLKLGVNYVGSLSHLQLYVTGGGSTPPAMSDHTTQWQAGLTGLGRQHTGERIRTILGYAGLVEAQMQQIDPGTSVMARAALAGKTIAQALYEARDTEQGALYIDGQGLPVFADRRTLLNI